MKLIHCSHHTRLLGFFEWTFHRYAGWRQQAEFRVMRSPRLERERIIDLCSARFSNGLGRTPSEPDESVVLNNSLRVLKSRYLTRPS